ncbi:hypothetical protein [Terriglobus sp. RCC_193]
MNIRKKPYIPAAISDYGDAQQITKTVNSSTNTIDTSGSSYTS